jgi:hypothetical protein
VGSVIFNVSDEAGTPITGAKVVMTAYSNSSISKSPLLSWLGMGATNTYTAYTDSDGKALINFADTVLGFDYKYTVSADGYETQIGTGNVGYCYCQFNVYVTMPKIYTSSSSGSKSGCPPGYSMDSSGNCVQTPYANTTGEIANWFQQHETAVLITAIIITLFTILMVAMFR